MGMARRLVLRISALSRAGLQARWEADQTLQITGVRRRQITMPWAKRRDGSMNERLCISRRPAVLREPKES